MANTDIEKLIVSLEARTKEYEKALAKAQGTTVTQLRKIEREAQGFATRFDAKMGMIGGSLKGLLAGASVAAVAAFGAAIKSAVSDAASIGDLADKVGLSTDAIQELSYGAVQANLSFDDLSGSLTKFSKTLGEAQNGSGDLLKTLEANGFDQARVKALSMADALGVVADLVKNARNEQDQLLIITQAFGRGGDGMLEFLKNGSAGLQGFAKDATEAGAKIEESLIRKAQQWDDSWAALMLSMKAGLQDFVLTSLFEVEKLSGAFDAMMKKSPPTGVGRFGAPIGKAGGLGGHTSSAPVTPSTPPRIFPEAGVGGFSYSAPGKLTEIVDPEREAKLAAAKREQIRLAKEAARAEVQRREAVLRVVEAMQFESAQAKRSEREQFVQNELRSAGEKLTAAEAAQVRALAEARYAEIEAQKLADANKEISLENQKELIAAQEDQNQKAMEALEAQKEGWMNLANIGVSALDAIVIGGEKASDVLKDMVKQLASAALQAALLGQGPLAGLFGTSGGGGFFGSLIAGMGGSTFAGIYHSGGVVGSGGMRRTVSPGMFAGAERYHNGGVAGLRAGEVPAILQKGEMVLPRGRGMGSGQSVMIVDQRTNAPPIERDDLGGMVRMVVRDEVGRHVPGAVRKQLGGYGISAPSIRRGGGA